MWLFCSCDVLSAVLSSAPAAAPAVFLSCWQDLARACTPQGREECVWEVEALGRGICRKNKAGEFLVCAGTVAAITHLRMQLFGHQDKHYLGCCATSQLRTEDLFDCLYTNKRSKGGTQGSTGCCSQAARCCRLVLGTLSCSAAHEPVSCEQPSHHFLCLLGQSPRSTDRK